MEEPKVGTGKAVSAKAENDNAEAIKSSAGEPNDASTEAERDKTDTLESAAAKPNDTNNTQPNEISVSKTPQRKLTGTKTKKQKYSWLLGTVPSTTKDTPADFNNASKTSANESKPTAAATASNADAETEHAVASILAHSFLPATGGGVANTVESPKLLVVWAGADPATSAARPPSWEDLDDVGAPYIASFYHALHTAALYSSHGASGRPAESADENDAARLIEEPRDGRTYVYADKTTEHRLCPEGSSLAAARKDGQLGDQTQTRKRKRTRPSKRERLEECNRLDEDDAE